MAVACPSINSSQFKVRNSMFIKNYQLFNLKIKDRARSFSYHTNMNRFINTRNLGSFFLLIVLSIFVGKGLLYLVDYCKTTWHLKAIILGAVNFFMLFALIVNHEKGKRYIPYVLAIYISQTGFNYAIKPGYYTSANEVLTFTILLIWIVRRLLVQRPSWTRLYFSRYVKFFLIVAAAGIVTAFFVFQVSPLNIFIISKSYILYLFYLILIPDCVRSERELQRILIFLLAVSLIPLYYAVTSSLTIDYTSYERLTLNNWGTLNVFVGYILPVFFVSFGLLLQKGKKWQKFSILFYMGTIVYVLLVTQTRTGWGALLAGTGFFIFMTKKKIIASFAIILIAISIMYSPLGQHLEDVVTHRIVSETLKPDHSIRDRYSRWDAAWATAKTYPLTGSGWGGLLPFTGDGTVGDTSISLLPLWHNSYLEILSQLGFPGLLAFLMLWGKIIKVEGTRLYHLPQSQQPTIYVGLFIAVVACLIYALAEQQFYRIETASHTYFLSGLLLAASKVKSNMMKSPYA